MCNCPENTLQDEELRYSRMDCIELPDSMQAERLRRIKEGLWPQIAVDSCIVAEIKKLWDLGIRTTGCCCGHNKLESFVNVDIEDSDKMIELGYVLNHADKARKDTFRLKSV